MLPANVVAAVAPTGMTLRGNFVPTFSQSLDRPYRSGQTRPSTPHLLRCKAVALHADGHGGRHPYPGPPPERRGAGSPPGHGARRKARVAAAGRAPALPDT